MVFTGAFILQIRVNDVVFEVPASGEVMVLDNFPTGSSDVWLLAWRGRCGVFLAGSSGITVCCCWCCSFFFSLKVFKAKSLLEYSLLWWWCLPNLFHTFHNSFHTICSWTLIFPQMLACVHRLDVWASAALLNQLGGLCGNYDGSRVNEFQSRSGSVYDANPWPIAFPVSWRVMRLLPFTSSLLPHFPLFCVGIPLKYLCCIMPLARNDVHPLIVSCILVELPFSFPL